MADIQQICWCYMFCLCKREKRKDEPRKKFSC